MEQATATEAAQAAVTKEEAENPMSGGSVMRTLLILALLATLFFAVIFMMT